MQIQLYNSLGRKKELFEPLEKGHVKIYSCGPTVYASPHIGNFRAFIFADLLRRSFEFLGFTVEHVMNITDVGHLTSDSDSGEDKLDAAAAREKVSPLEIARKYEAEFLEDLEKLNILTPHHLPRASEHIAEQIELIKKLEAKGFTYETSDGIYFDTSKFEHYGKLGGQNVEEKEAGARVAVKSEKRNPADFALWKFCVGENANHILRWPNPSGEGEGFPVWHIECSAMSMRYLAPEVYKDLESENKASDEAGLVGPATKREPHGGEADGGVREGVSPSRSEALFDIHTGGVDHIPVHHENEIAQSEAAIGKKSVNFWLHNEFLTVDGGKMSKSLGNLFTLKELEEKGFEALAFRYFCLNSNYRGKLNFSWEALKNAQNSLEKLRAEFQKLPTEGGVDEEAIKEFGAALADDLNSPRALAVAWEYVKKSGANQATLAKFDEVLGLDLGKVEKVEISEKQQKLRDERKQARAEKDFAKSDEIRDEFASMGFEIEDKPDGSQILKKKK